MPEHGSRRHGECTRPDAADADVASHRMDHGAACRAWIMRCTITGASCHVDGCRPAGRPRAGGCTQPRLFRRRRRQPRARHAHARQRTARHAADRPAGSVPRPRWQRPELGGRRAGTATTATSCGCAAKANAAAASSKTATVEVFWNHTVATFWSTQLGVRHDFGEGPRAQLGRVRRAGPGAVLVRAGGDRLMSVPAGRTAARLRADYELLFTQRLILQPEAGDQPVRQERSAATHRPRSVRCTVRPAPALRDPASVRAVYRGELGASFRHHAPTTRAQDRQPVFDRQIVAGVRIWF